MNHLRTNEKNPILPLRIEIDEIDSALIELLALRLELSTKIGKVKHLRGLAVHDSSRENQILSKIDWHPSSNASQTEAIKAIYQEIFRQSKLVQNNEPPLTKTAE